MHLPLGGLTVNVGYFSPNTDLHPVMVAMVAGLSGAETEQVSNVSQLMITISVQFIMCIKYTAHDFSCT